MKAVTLTLVLAFTMLLSIVAPVGAKPRPTPTPKPTPSPTVVVPTPTPFSFVLSDSDMVVLSTTYRGQVPPPPFQKDVPVVVYGSHFAPNTTWPVNLIIECEDYVYGPIVRTINTTVNVTTDSQGGWQLLVDQPCIGGYTIVINSGYSITTGWSVYF